MIKAPYNFVPLESTAFYPEWANHISHDIPFEDGVSGSIEYTMEAETPIFVRNGYPNSDYPKKGDKPNPDPTFSHIGSGDECRYFIPGTSVKGEIRNVLEILGFGKMTRVQDARFGIRDLNDKLYRDQVKNVHCGWLFCEKSTMDGDEYKLIDCGIPYRISPEDVDGVLGTSLTRFKEEFNSGRKNADKDQEESIRSACYKYNEILGLGLKGSENCERLLKDSLSIRFDAESGEYGREIATPDESGRLSGTIVVTGQPDKRQQKNGKWTGKYYEFVFPDSEVDLDVDPLVVKDFLAIHKNNYDFKKLWNENLHRSYKIPVFFTMKNGNVDAIGLSGMFRVPSASFIKGAIPASLQSNRHKDLAECIFGTAGNSLGYLKGRVVFSPAFADGDVRDLAEVRTTLSSPKPSYGPLYVKGGTWNSSAALIKGRKRYPVLGWNVNINDRNNDTGNGNTETKFRPLAAGTVFSGKIYFHNLRRCELGALISALTFNGHPECFHSIGEAKPLGYGKVKTNILKISDLPVTENEAPSGLDVTDKTRYYLGLFEDMMSGFSPSWKLSESLSQLFAMAKGIPAAKESEFAYMSMSTDSGNNEFALVKSTKDGHVPENLPMFSKILEGKNDYIGKADWERKYGAAIGQEIDEVDRRLDQRDAVIDGIDQANRLLANNDYTTALQLVSRLQEIVDAPDETGTLTQYRAAIKNLGDEVLNGIRDGEGIRKDNLQGEAENLFQKAKDSKDDPSKRRIAWLSDAISKCNDALSIKVNLEADVHLHQLRDECEKLMKKIIDGGKSLQEAFEGGRLASMAAFVGKIKHWKTDSGVEVLSEEELTFLGNFVKGNLGSLKKKDQKPWLDHQCWNKNFACILSPEDIDYVFNIVNGD